MKRAAVNIAVLAAVMCPAVSGAREFQIRRLEGNSKNAVWGTREFQVTVSSSGVLRHVKVGGQELIWQAAALYTSPVPPGASKGVRTVQGEGYGTRGLSVKPPAMTTRDEKGKRVLELEHLVSNKQVLDGRPLCRVAQRVVITPTGEIHVSYDCHWLQTLRWAGFQSLLFYDRTRCQGREYMALDGQCVLVGRLDPGPLAQRRIRSLALGQLTVRPAVGPFHVVWDHEARSSFQWSEGIQLSVTPRCVPHRGFVYKGQKGRIAYRILLPVSQQ